MGDPLGSRLPLMFPPAPQSNPLTGAGYSGLQAGGTAGALGLGYGNTLSTVQAAQGHPDASLLGNYLSVAGGNVGLLGAQAGTQAGGSHLAWGSTAALASSVSGGALGAGFGLGVASAPSQGVNGSANGGALPLTDSVQGQVAEAKLVKILL